MYAKLVHRDTGGDASAVVADILVLLVSVVVTECSLLF